MERDIHVFNCVTMELTRTNQDNRRIIPDLELYIFEKNRENIFTYRNFV